MNYDIKDKTILVTGANRGIGRAIVESFIEHGAAKVYAAIRKLDSRSPLVEQYGDRVVPIQVDLGDPQSIVAAAQTAKDVQVVVNNAGVFQAGTPLAEDAIASLEFQMNINVYGLIYMAQAFAPVLKANGGGVFAQINSVASLKGFSDSATYCASKAAAYSITQALRELLSKQGTFVLSVHPGPIATDMGDAAGLTEVAEPPALVADGMIEALKTGNFHVFPDSMAKQMGLLTKALRKMSLRFYQVNRIATALLNQGMVLLANLCRFTTRTLYSSIMKRQKFMKFSKVKMIHRLCQVLMSAGLTGLLAVLTMTKTPTAKADSQSDVTVFQPNNDAATCGDRCLTQLPLDRSLAIADVAQVMQPNPADVQDTQMIEERNKEIVQQYFDGWRNRTGNFFDLLAPEATWTITGTGAMYSSIMKRQKFMKFSKVKMIHRLCQVLMSAGLTGLLAVLTMTKTPTAKADSQSDVTVFQPNNDAATCGDRCLTQLPLDRSLAIADVAQVMQPNPADVQDTQMIEERNKEIVQQYFDGWRNRTGNFFDLLAPEATWTITGTGAMAGTYRSRQEFLDWVVNPTSARLSTPIVPTMRSIWADGDMVIVLWDGEATARDGKPYRNTYTWYFQMKDGKAIEAIAFLDMQEFTDLWTRVSPRN